MPPGDPDGLAERIARGYVSRMQAPGGADPFIALVRSAASDEASARRLLTAMREKSAAAYRRVLDVPDVDERVDLIGAHLIGVTFSRYVLGGGPLSAMSPEQLAGYLTASLDGILRAPVPGARALASPAG
jgi:Tetracyclin repressor-like, C-terminal domain